jgi:hypothetical protein
MDLASALSILALLALGWFAVRLATRRTRAQRKELLRQRTHSQRAQKGATQIKSARSDMRETDAPASASETFSQRAKRPPG